MGIPGLHISCSMDVRLFLPLLPAAFRGIASALLDRLDSMERRLKVLEGRPH